MILKVTALMLVLTVTLFSAIILFSLSNKTSKNRFYLGLFFANSFLLFVGNFLSFFNFWKAYRFFDFLFLASLLAFYPFYYRYLFSAFNIKIISTKWVYHFIPSIFIGIFMLIVSYLGNWNDSEIYMNYILYKSELTTINSKLLALLYNGSRYFHLIQIIIYTFLAIKFILGAKKFMSNSFSNIDKYQLQYFYITTISFITLMSVPGFYITLIGRSKFVGDSFQLLMLGVIFSILYLILIIIGLKQVPVEIQTSEENNLTNNFQNDELAQIEVELIHFFKQNKPWLDSNLTIWDVAKQTGTNRSYISKIINDHMGCNFNQFVNTYRINEAKKLLLKKPHLSVSEVSELSGFGTVNSFIRIFKNNTNSTPSKFRINN